MHILDIHFLLFDTHSEEFKASFIVRGRNEGIFFYHSWAQPTVNWSPRPVELRPTFWFAVTDKSLKMMANLYHCRLSNASMPADLTCII